jgi:hypothetical protein
MIAGGLAVLLPAGAETASALISSSTINELATHKRDGRRVRASGRVCAVARTRRQSRVTDTRRWCECVDVAAVLASPKEER